MISSAVPSVDLGGPGDGRQVVADLRGELVGGGAVPAFLNELGSTGLPSENTWSSFSVKTQVWPSSLSHFSATWPLSSGSPSPLKSNSVSPSYISSPTWAPCRTPEGRVDVVGLALGEVLEVDEGAALGTFSWSAVSPASAALVVVVTAAGGRHEREPQDESKELEAPALSSRY